MRIGFRKGEERRQENMLAKLNKNGNEEIKIVVGKRGTKNKWGMVEWRKPSFPLIDNAIDNKEIQSYWSKNTDIDFPKGLIKLSSIFLITGKQLNNKSGELLFTSS